ncbi:MAG: hypothetical protein HY306_06115 [Nitrosomonadales bacterium]|nr:hypothetical protein [Nitrosomonadales bacterium]
MKKLSEKAKANRAESLLFIMLIAMALFCMSIMSSEKETVRKNMEDFNAAFDVMVKLDSMNIAVLKESKLAKDVWVRGSDPAKLKQYRGEFVEQIGVFEKNYAGAMDSLKNLAMVNHAYDVFIEKLTPITVEHQVMSNNYLAQIDKHTGNAAESDAKVMGIDRVLSEQLTDIRDRFDKFLKSKGVASIAESQQDFNSRRNIILAGVLLSFGLSLWLLN